MSNIPIGTSMSISVIIATKDRAEPLRRCITSLLRQKRLPDELVVIDASTNEDVERMVKSLDGDSRIIYVRQKKGGLPSARNLGVRKCSGDIAVFLDDDVVLDPLYLEQIVAGYAGDHDLRMGGMTGVVVKDKRAHSNLERFMHFIRVLFFWDSLKDGRVTCIGMLSGLPGNCSYVEALYGHNMSFRREIFSEFEFDEGLEIYPLAMGEDIDFSYRVGRKYLLKVNPRAKIVHGGTSREDYKFTPEFYQASSTMFVRNFYSIMCKNIGRSLSNKVAFLWSVLGLLFGRIMFYLLYRAEEKKAGLRGVLRGLGLILSGTQIYRLETGMSRETT